MSKQEIKPVLKPYYKEVRMQNIEYIGQLIEYEGAFENKETKEVKPYKGIKLKLPVKYSANGKPVASVIKIDSMPMIIDEMNKFAETGKQD